ncbi:hypothetical protein COB55_01555 [Candidatus Wolfebacteria bacterium]|nr:MAG: hypothetical protein COB55_01555 [Candidatus Wolfebacteria bacterium]
MSDFQDNSIFWAEVGKVVPNPLQPRMTFDERKLQDLADSIRQYGILQPLVVTRIETEKSDGGLDVTYELIAGERRLRASKIAGLVRVPILIRGTQDSARVKLELAIIENLQREDLNPVDRARAFDRLAKDFGFKHAEIGKKMGKSREYVSNTLRLLNLPDEMQEALVAGKITEGHTRPLMMLNDQPQEREVLFKEIVFKKVTVRDAEMIARRMAQHKVRNMNYKIDPVILDMEEKMSEKLGTKVQINKHSAGGRILIDFFSQDDLQHLIDVINREGGNVPIMKTYTKHDSDPQTSTVSPAPTDSLSEKENETVLVQEKSKLEEDEIINPPTLTDDEVSAPILTAEEAVKEEIKEPEPFVPKEKEEDEDLYSIKNFSL